VRIAAATCVVTSGLLIGGVGGALAFAKPPSDAVSVSDDGEGAPPGVRTGGADTDHPQRREQKPDNTKSRGSKLDDVKPGGQKPVDSKPADKDSEADEDSQAGDAGGTITTPEPTRSSDAPPPTKTTEPPPPTDEPDAGQCDDNSDDDCGAGIPWWPFPFPWPFPWDPGVGAPPGDGGGASSSGGGFGGLPSELPAMRLPAELFPETEPGPAEPIDSTPGAGVSAEALPLQPITMPVVIAPPPIGVGVGTPRLAAPEPVPRSMRPEPRTGKQPSVDLGSNANIPPASYRVGYTDYLRSAGVSQVMALAGPGVAGILLLTGAGGLVGYRQAKAGHAVRTGGTARFMN
jgi:hypothetical protein